MLTIIQIIGCEQLHTIKQNKIWCKSKIFMVIVYGSSYHADLQTESEYIATVEWESIDRAYLVCILQTPSCLLTWCFLTEAYSEPTQISKTELFVKIFNGLKPWSIFTKSSILDISVGSECTSVWEALRQ